MCKNIAMKKAKNCGEYLQFLWSVLRKTICSVLRRLNLRLLICVKLWGYCGGIDKAIYLFLYDFICVSGSSV